MPSIIIFPEGASTNGDYMLRYHLGAFLTDLPIQPAAISYTIWGLDRHMTSISFFHNYPRHLLSFFCIPGITVKIDFLDTMSLKTDGDGNPRQLADEAALKIGNYLGVRVLNLSTSSLFKKN